MPIDGCWCWAGRSLLRPGCVAGTPGRLSASISGAWLGRLSSAATMASPVRRWTGQKPCARSLMTCCGSGWRSGRRRRPCRTRGDDRQHLVGGHPLRCRGRSSGPARRDAVGGSRRDRAGRVRRRASGSDRASGAPANIPTTRAPLATAPIAARRQPLGLLVCDVMNPPCGAGPDPCGDLPSAGA